MKWKFKEMIDRKQNNRNQDMPLSNVGISSYLSTDTSNFETSIPSFDLGETRLLNL